MDRDARRRLILLVVVLVAGSVLALIRVWLEMLISGQLNMLWIYGIAGFDIVLVAAAVVQTRKRELGLSDFAQHLAPRVKEQGSSKKGWVLAVFDNGLVMQGQRQGAVVSFYLCYGSDLQRYAPSLPEVQDYMRGFGVMRRVEVVTRKKGDPSVRSMLDQLRQQLGARWVILSLNQRSPDKRPSVKAPSWILGVSCYWPKWSRNPEAVLNGIDPVSGLLDLAQRQHFASVMAAG